MEERKNGMAIAGFILSVCSVPALAAGFLCLIRVMLTPLLSVIFGEMAGLVAILGIVLSGIGHSRSHREDMDGVGFSLAGLLTGTVVVTLTLAFAALMIVAWAVYGVNPIA